MLDQYGRRIDYLRISVTDRCNLRCVYCMPEIGIAQIACKDLLSYEEILYLCNIFAQLGIQKIKLTGGEPLVRRNICRLIAGIKAIAGIEQVTITTNGLLLESMAEELIDAGIDGINISLDAMQPKRFATLTRRDHLDTVLRGLYKLLARGYGQIKMNCVPIKEVNDDQITEIAALARQHKIAVRFIELMPIGLAADYTAISKAELFVILSQAYGELIPWQGTLGNGPAEYFSLPGFQGKIGFIAAMHNQFCSQCNRIRLTADGFMKLCLQYDIGVDLKYLLRQQANVAYIKKVVERNIYAKPREHHFLDGTVLIDDDQRKMFQVGG